MTAPPKQINWDIHEALSLPKERLIETLSSHYQNFQICQQQADEGDLEAQLYVAACYDTGQGVFSSQKKAFHYYKLAADQGDPQAQVSTAFCYESGQGVDQSDQQAFHYYQLAADQGSSVAQALLGKLYAEGKGIESSNEKALYYYQLAAEQENLLACEYLAEAYAKGVGAEFSPEKAAFYADQIKQKADAHEAAAQFKVGRLFEKGIGVAKSLASAFYYYKLAADQGHIFACLAVADYFIEGKGVAPSLENAISYYKIAADLDYIPAQTLLALCLLRHKLNDELAVHYLKLVAQTGNEAYTRSVAVCQCNLAECFEEGRGIKKSSQNALYYYRLAADNGNEFAQDRLGEAYLKGELGLKSDAKRAVDYYRLAAGQGNEFSLTRLAECYEAGKGVEQSFEQAFKYYKLAADIQIKKGTSTAIVQLAKCYEWGIGTEPSLNKAIYYYKLAGDNGLESGYYHAALCYRKLSGPENAEKALACLKISAAAHYAPAEAELKASDNTESQNRESQYQVALEFLKNKEQVYQQLVLASPEQQVIVAQLYEQIKEIENHEQEAFKYCQLAADRGYAPAQYQLGCYYEKGIGTFKSLEQALKYFNLAAKQGFEEAIKKCQRSNLSGIFAASSTNRNERGLNKKPSSQMQAVSKLNGIGHAIHQMTHMKIESLDVSIPVEALDPQSQRINIDPYLNDQNIETLKKIFEVHKNSAIYLQASQPVEIELEVLRDAMIQNSKFTFICSLYDAHRLSIIFERMGYDPKTCLKQFKLPYQDYYSVSYLPKAA